MNKNYEKNPFRRWAILTSVLLALGSTMLTAFAIFTSYFCFHLVTNPEVYAVLATIPVFILSFSGLYVIFRYILRYLTNLTNSMSKVARRNFDMHLNPDEAGPLKKLYQDFNQMTAELGSIQTMRDDFIGQFSHEFRTPITSMNGFAKLLLEKDLKRRQKKRISTNHCARVRTIKQTI